MYYINLCVNIYVHLSDNTLCRLVCKLLELSQCGDQSVVMATSKCLGVLGPADLKQIYIPPSPPSTGLEKALVSFEVRMVDQIGFIFKLYICYNSSSILFFSWHIFFYTMGVKLVYLTHNCLFCLSLSTIKGSRCFLYEYLLHLLLNTGLFQEWI